MSRAKKKAAQIVTITSVTTVGIEVKSWRAAPMQAATRSMLLWRVSIISCWCSSRNSRLNRERNSAALLRKSATGWENSEKPLSEARERKAAISRAARIPTRTSTPHRAAKAKTVERIVAAPLGMRRRF